MILGRQPIVQIVILGDNMIKWQDEYSTGYEAIDKQHKFLFNFFNDFEEDINDGRGAVYLEKYLHLLEAYAKSHFNYEEGCMFEHKCPMAQKNKTAHKSFLTTVDEYGKRFRSGHYAEDFFVEMHHFIEQWIINHIIGIDTHLRECSKG